MAEPGSGARVDAAPEVLRTGLVPPGTEAWLGHAAGTLTSRGVPEALASLMDRESGPVYLCGVDPREASREILRGVEEGTLVLSGAMYRALGVPVPDHGLPASYVLNPVRYFDDTPFRDEWQREVYDLALDLAVAHDWRRIVDIGCGSGYKLVQRFAEPRFRTLGVDLPETVECLRSRYPDRDWIVMDIEREDILSFRADLIIVSDLIEHVTDPDALLRFIAGCDSQAIVISTPDATTLIERGEAQVNGPPRNPYHVREWTLDQFSRYTSGVLEVLEQRLYPENATQLLLCRAPARSMECYEIKLPPMREVSAPGERAEGSRFAAPLTRVTLDRSQWIDLSDAGYESHSRTRVLEQRLRGSESDWVTVALDPQACDLEVAEELERRVREGCEIGLRSSNTRCGERWNPLDGAGLLVCERERLLRALALERGLHGPERALLRLVESSTKRIVEPGVTEEDPASCLARLGALLDLYGPAVSWADPRPAMGAAVRRAAARAEAHGRPALAEDLLGFWSARTGAALTESPRSSDPDKLDPTDPEFEVALEAGSAWTLVRPGEPDPFRTMLEHAAKGDPGRVLNLALPWAAGVPMERFIESVTAALTGAGLDPERIAPLVVLERPLWSSEIAWLVRHLRRV